MAKPVQTKFGAGLPIFENMQSIRFKIVAWLAFSIYFLLLIKLILLKHPSKFLHHLLHASKSNLEQGNNHLVWRPFKTTFFYLSGEKGFWLGLENIGGNIFGFTPLGFMLPILFATLNTGKKVIFCVFLVSLGFETIQFITGVGYPDIDDLWQNTLGGCIGWWLYKHCGKLFLKKTN